MTLSASERKVKSFGVYPNSFERDYQDEPFTSRFAAPVVLFLSPLQSSSLPQSLTSQFTTESFKYLCGEPGVSATTSGETSVEMFDKDINSTAQIDFF